MQSALPAYCHGGFAPNNTLPSERKLKEPSSTEFESSASNAPAKLRMYAAMSIPSAGHTAGRRDQRSRNAPAPALSPPLWRATRVGGNVALATSAGPPGPQRCRCRPATAEPSDKTDPLLLQDTAVPLVLPFRARLGGLPCPWAQAWLRLKTRPEFSCYSLSHFEVQASTSDVAHDSTMHWHSNKNLYICLAVRVSTSG